MSDSRRDPRLDPQAGDRLSIDGVVVEVIEQHDRRGRPAVEYAIGSFRPWVYLDTWTGLTWSATVEHVAGGSDV